MFVDISGIVHLLLVACLWFSTATAQCVYKGCFCGCDTIYCEDMFLTSVPQITNSTGGCMYMPQLSLDRNQVTRISTGSLIANLSGLSAANNPLETIDDEAFAESSNTLQSLVFSGATFTQLPTAVLRLRALTSLSMSNINITVWNDSAMVLLGSGIQSLTLDRVGLTAWPSWLHAYVRLFQLTVSGSSISSIPDDAFNTIANRLTELNLSNNNLTAVPKAMSNLTHLMKLSLANNRITDITWLPQLSKLTSLSLNNNQISDSAKLSASLLYYATTLSEFTIHNNILTSLPDVSFLTLMTTLDFTHNHISDSNSGSVSSALIILKLDSNHLTTIPVVLKTIRAQYVILHLSYNSITTVQGIDFPTSTSGVDLGGNLIQELNDTSFPYNSSIVYLYLYSNPLTIVSPLAFQNLPRLRELNLRSTSLSRLPLAIASLKGLWSIDVTGSTRLVCTCEEKSLETIIRAAFDVFGDCGPTSLYNFFNNFSPTCPSKR
ncbi:hypothetical protein BsWGS_23263 [Bradybaena similaris]